MKNLVALGALITIWSVGGTAGAFAQCACESDDASVLQDHLMIYGTSALTVDLIGESITTSEGKKLGVIKELVVAPETGRIAYVIVSSRHFGDHLFAIPWRVVHLAPDRRVFVLAGDQRTLQSAPNFSPDTWSNPSPSHWAAVDEYWEKQTEQRLATAHPADPTVYKISELIGMTLHNLEKEKLGTIEEFVISLQRGHLTYVILSFKTTQGGGQTFFFGLPWKVVQINPRQHTFIARVDKQDLLEELLRVSQNHLERDIVFESAGRPQFRPRRQS